MEIHPWGRRWSPQPNQGRRSLAPRSWGATHRPCQTREASSTTPSIRRQVQDLALTPCCPSTATAQSSRRTTTTCRFPRMLEAQFFPVWRVVEAVRVAQRVLRHLHLRFRPKLCQGPETYKSTETFYLLDSPQTFTTRFDPSSKNDDKFIQSNPQVN